MKFVSLDCEMVKGVRRHIVGRVVLVGKADDGSFKLLLDTYVRHPPGAVVNCLTRWSRITPVMLAGGLPHSVVVQMVIGIIRGTTLVTQNGRADFACLGLDQEFVSSICNHVELQSYFKRPDGSGYGLGPLVEYFKYTANGEPVIINHNCIQDALYTLIIYADHFKSSGVFVPAVPIPSVKQFRERHGIE